MPFQDRRNLQYSNTILSMTEIQPKSGASDKDVPWYRAEVDQSPNQHGTCWKNTVATFRSPDRSCHQSGAYLKSNRFMNQLATMLYAHFTARKGLVRSTLLLHRLMCIPPARHPRQSSLPINHRMHQERQEGFGSRFLLRARHPANM